MKTPQIVMPSPDMGRSNLMKAWILIAALFLYCTAARSEFYSGNDLHNQCIASLQPYVRMYSAGVIGAAKFENSKYFCVPASANLGQVGDVVCKFVAENPEARHYPAAVLVIRSLRVAWPCAEK